MSTSGLRYADEEQESIGCLDLGGVSLLEDTFIKSVTINASIQSRSILIVD